MIVSTILNGRNNRMPAQEHLLTPEQIRLLSAWVWGLSGGKDVTVSSVMSGNTTK
jgi:cytochrome c oxidase cbb3-type subunit 3